MLLELQVKNFALIDELSLTFESGLNVFTGETGAGKSILVGAINLILGGRASTEQIRQGTEEAEVQALFTLDEAAERRLSELGWPETSEALIKRVLSKSGRNRIYINGAMATLAQLAGLGRELMAISGQHEHQQLLDPEKQLYFLDQFGGLLNLRSQMTEAHADMLKLKSEAAGFERSLVQAREKAELADFQAKEIQSAGPAPDEDEILGRERELLRNAEKILGFVKTSQERLKGDEGAILDLLSQVRGDLDRAVVFDDKLGPILAQITEAYHQLDDAAEFLRHRLDLIVFDPARLEEIEERLALLARLKRKYGPTLPEVLEYGLKASGRLENLAEMEQRLEAIKLETLAAIKHTRMIADELSAARHEKAKLMSEQTAAQLRSLGMPHLQFEIAFKPRPDNPEPSPTGMDEIEFMISPNLGEDLKPLARIASGGELSRAMLGIKSLLAGQEKIQTVIFDEVDSGIGGAVAEVVGRKIKSLSAFHQILCITHLPQIAAFGDHHIQVFKEVRGARTQTGLRALSIEERVEEIARMIGGASLTDKARAAAKELIAKAEKTPEQG